MYVYVSRKCLRESVKQTPQTNKARVIKKADVTLKATAVTPEIEASVTKVIELVTSDIKAKRERKRRPMKEWDALFQPKGK